MATTSDSHEESEKTVTSKKRVVSIPAYPKPFLNIKCLHLNLVSIKGTNTINNMTSNQNQHYFQKGGGESYQSGT